MKHTRLLVLSLVVVALLIAPVMALAQDGEEEEGWVEFTTEMGLTVHHPEEMVAGEDEEIPYPHVLVASDEEVMALLLSEEEEDTPAEPGQSAVMILLFPQDILMMMAPEVDFTAEEMDWEAFMAMLTEELGDEDAEIGEPELVEVEVDGETYELGVIGFSSEEGDGAYIAYGEEGIWAVGMAMAATGEFEDFQDTALHIFASTSFEGTAEDLMNAMMEAMSGGE